MKILFIQAEDPTNILDFQFPSGVACLEAILTRAGHQVDFLWRVANYLTLKDVYKNLLEKKPDIVGISFCFSVIREVIDLVKVVKLFDEDIPVVLGGPGASYISEFILEKTGADFIIQGEGEKALLELVENLEKRKAVGRKIIKGDLIPLENIPLPTWEKYPIHWYMRTGEFMYKTMTSGCDRVFNWISSRGCLMKCNFCVSGCEPRFKSIDFLEYELREIKERFHPTFLGWMDNITIANKKRCIEFCEMHLKNNFGWTYYITGWVPSIDEEMLKYLKQSGCVGIMYGIESANDRILKFIGKNFTVTQLERAIKLTKEAGIRVQLSAMFGQPGETREDWINTLNMILLASDENLPTSNNQGLSNVITFPGTPLYDWAKTNGYFIDEEDYYNQFFQDRYGFINYTEYPREEVLSFQRIVRIINNWNYHRTAYFHSSRYLKNIGIGV